jgi:hypothetical protein
MSHACFSVPFLLSRRRPWSRHVISRLPFNKPRTASLKVLPRRARCPFSHPAEFLPCKKRSDQNPFESRVQGMPSCKNAQILIYCVIRLAVPTICQMWSKEPSAEGLPIRQIAAALGQDPDVVKGWLGPLERRVSVAAPQRQRDAHQTRGLSQSSSRQRGK